MGGRILIVSSIGGVRAGVGSGPYTMTKHAIQAFGTALRQELKMFGVDVCLINPGPYATGFNDRMAMGAYDAIRKLNLKIPNDVAVIGFDNQELIAANLYPPLSTMELPHYEMGVWAVQKLVKILSSVEQGEPEQHKIECPLIERESV